MWQFIAHFKLHCSLAVICLTTVLPIHSTVTDFDMYMVKKITFSKVMFMPN